MTNYKRDESMPLIEQVREITFAETDPDDMLCFYPVAIALGCSESEAESIDQELNTRIMRAGGMI